VFIPRLLSVYNYELFSLSKGVPPTAIVVAIYYPSSAAEFG